MNSGCRFFFRNLRFLRDSELTKLVLIPKQCPMMQAQMTLSCVQGKDIINRKRIGIKWTFAVVFKAGSLLVIDSSRVQVCSFYFLVKDFVSKHWFKSVIIQHLEI